MINTIILSQKLKNVAFILQKLWYLVKNSNSCKIKLEFYKEIRTCVWLCGNT